MKSRITVRVPRGAARLRVSGVPPFVAETPFAAARVPFASVDADTVGGSRRFGAVAP